MYINRPKEKSVKNETKIVKAIDKIIVKIDAVLNIVFIISRYRSLVYILTMSQKSR